MMQLSITVMTPLYIAKPTKGESVATFRVSQRSFLRHLTFMPRFLTVV